MATRNALLFFVFIGLLLLFNVGLVQSGTVVSFFIYETILFVTLLLLVSERRRLVWGRSRALLLGVGLGAALISVLFASYLAGGWLRPEGLATRGLFLVLATAVLFQALVASGEELAFRGYMLSHLREAVSDRTAIGATALLFSGIHAPTILLQGASPLNGALWFATLTAGGGLLAVVAIRWGLLAAVGLHFAWNFLQYHVYSMALPSSSLLALSIGQGPPVLTGGTCSLGGFVYLCGPEASLLGLVAFAIPLALFTRQWRAKNAHT